MMPREFYCQDCGVRFREDPKGNLVRCDARQSACALPEVIGRMIASVYKRDGILAELPNKETTRV